MESPIFFGLGAKLQRVLQALDVTNLGSPVWTLKENKGKIYLDLCWSKFPATSPQVTSQPEPARAGSTSINDQKQRGPDSASYANASPTPVKEISPKAPSSKTKKKKSPATKKRDRERLVKWLSQKWSGVSRIKSSTGNPPAATVKRTSESALDKKPVSTQSNPASCEDFKLPDADVRLSPVKSQRPSILSKSPLSLEHRPRTSSQPQASQAQAKESASFDSDPVSDDELDLNQCSNTACMVPAYLAPKGLKKCTRCYKVSYCGRDCQSKHWKFHRLDCGKI